LFGKTLILHPLHRKEDLLLQVTLHNHQCLLFDKTRGREERREKWGEEKKKKKKTGEEVMSEEGREGRGEDEIGIKRSFAAGEGGRGREGKELTLTE
jgi:hypothetical protein